MQDFKLMGLKSHDCHVLMQDFLLVAIRGISPKNVRQVITRLFNVICRKVIDPNSLDELEMKLSLSCVNKRCIFLLHFLTLWFI